MALITNSIGYESDTAMQDTIDEDIINVANAWELATIRAERQIDIVNRTILKTKDGVTFLEPANADLLTVIVPEVKPDLSVQLDTLIIEGRYAAIQVLSMFKIPRKLPFVPLKLRKEGFIYIPEPKGETTLDFIKYSTIDEARDHFDDLIAGLLEKI